MNSQPLRPVGDGCPSCRESAGGFTLPARFPTGCSSPLLPRPARADKGVCRKRRRPVGWFTPHRPPNIIMNSQPLRPVGDGYPSWRESAGGFTLARFPTGCSSPLLPRPARADEGVWKRRRPVGWFTPHRPPNIIMNFQAAPPRR